VVSKTKYYELKAQGKCVKCSSDRGNSPSEVRCAECHERYLESKKTNQNTRLESGLCIQCGKAELLGNSKYCPACREKNATSKKNLTEQTISLYQENNENCRLCNGPIDTLGIICQKCLDQVQFSKRDAVIRYNEQCLKCAETDLEKLVFASADISVPMKHSGPELYRFICFSSLAPKEYILVCSACYWKDNFKYIKNLRSALLGDAAETTDDIIVDGIIESNPGSNDIEDAENEFDDVEEDMENDDDELD
jgi:hypothetical protein